ncbi:hypothetical protein AB4Y64_14310 [Lysobacter sp. TAF61]|uniref:hypothetical protein n=1 Tax=Lysobacter sp. TAF61 TaxID=3233072 RepID=UPI003F9A980F
MKAKIAFIALALAASMPAWAEQSKDPIGDLSQITGLSERKVQMVLGNRTAFAEYPYTYDRALDKFVDAVGEVKYQQLMNGESVAITDKQGHQYLVQVKRENKDAL